MEEYLQTLPEDRRVGFTRLLETVRANIDPGFAEEISYGMPGWVVPKSTYPEGYHCAPELPVPFLSIANQKGYIAYYHMGVYADPAALAWFQEEYAATGLRLDMGKSCIRFKKPEQIPFELMGRLTARIGLEEYLDGYVAALDARSSRAKR